MRLHQHSLCVVHMLTSASVVVQYTATETCLVVFCFDFFFCLFVFWCVCVGGGWFIEVLH